MRIFLILIFLSLIFLFSRPVNALTGVVNHLSASVSVTATVGEPKLTLFGYTSPFALVNLSGIGVANQTTADETGYFFFNKVFYPIRP